MLGWFLYSSAWVSLCAGGLTLSSFLLGRTAIDAPYLALTVFGTYLVYSLDRRLTRLSPEDQVNRPAAVAWQARNRIEVAVLIACALGALACYAYLDGPVRIGVALVVLASLAYVLPALPGVSQRLRIKSLGRLKAAYLALVWAAGTTAIPFISVITVAGHDGQAGSIDWPLLCAVAARTLVLLANAIMFDVLDYAGDAGHGLRTLAVRRGRSAALRQARGWTLSALVLAGLGAVGFGKLRVELLLEALPALGFLGLLLMHRRLRRSGLRDFAPQIYDGALLLYLPLQLALSAGR